MSGSQYYAQAVADAQQYGVPANLFTDMIAAESNWQPAAYNTTTGATGIAQFLPSTAADPGYGITPFDPTAPAASLSAAAQYLAGLYQQFGTWTGALDAYSGATQGSTPYQGNAMQPVIQSDLASLGETGATPGGATAAPAGGSLLSPSAWLSALGAYASRAALVLLAIVFLLGAMFLFAMRSEHATST